MTPGARIAAAIEILDLILVGSTPEKALTGWGRTHRFAGSKDRAAIRDHVFGALRCRASFAWLGGAVTGRGIMLGATAFAGTQDALFNGEGHAPAARLAEETLGDISIAPRHVALDTPEWLLPYFDAALGDEADTVLKLMQARAGVFLRVNVLKATPEQAADALASDGIVTASVKNMSSALQVIENERRVVQSTAYLNGLVELQDTSSQAAIEVLGIKPSLRVLDLCAGGGGKALAMAAFGADVTAHDIDPRRMVDLTPRAQRAGANIATFATADLASCDPFDLVLCDAPCSGSGTWRRTPSAKWSLTPQRLFDLTQMQDEVLDTAAGLIRAGGILAYATCSIFEVENKTRIQSFLARNSSYSSDFSRLTTPHETGDGFYLSVLRRED
jgi:16S rRNA (cytosine967-C5)-methyltransferase